MNLGLIPSLFLFFGVLSLLYAGAIHYFLKTPDWQSARHWSLGSLVWGVSILLTIFRKEVPLLLSYYAANAIAFLAYIELNRALRALIGTPPARPPRRWLDALLLLAYTAALYAIGHGMTADFAELAKVSFVSGLVVIVSVQGARYCFQIASAHHLKIAQNFGYLYVAVAALWLARIMAAAVFQASSAFDPAPVNTVIWVAVFITGVVKYMIFPVMLLQKTENEKQSRLKQTLVKANRTVTSGALSASIAHELSQPLAAILINGQTLRKSLEDRPNPARPRDDEVLRAIVDDILSANDRAAKIITSLRAIFGQSQTEIAEVELAGLVRKTVAMIEKDIHTHEIRLALHLEEGLCAVISEDEFQQVLINLLINSIHALRDTSSDRPRVISIETRSVGSGAVIVVSDSGPGIRKEMEDSLFEILSSSKDTGMGIGLWLCKYIVERHGGRIVHLPAELGGAAFKITLPLCRNPLAIPAHPA